MATITQRIASLRRRVNGILDPEGTVELLSIMDALDGLGDGDIKADGSVPFTGEETFQLGLKANLIQDNGADGVTISSTTTNGNTGNNFDAAVNKWGLGDTNTVTPFGNGLRMVASNATKSITIRSTNDTAEVAINGAGVSGQALSVTGGFGLLSGNIKLSDNASVIPDDPASDRKIKFGGEAAKLESHVSVANDIFVTVLGDADGEQNGTKITIDDFAKTIVATAANGFSTSAGLNVAGATGAGTTDNAWVKIAAGTTDHAVINFGDPEVAAPANLNEGDFYSTSSRLHYVTHFQDETIAYLSDIPTSSGWTASTGIENQDGIDSDAAIYTVGALQNLARTVAAIQNNLMQMGLFTA